MTCEHHDYTILEAYIRNLPWSAMATDDERTLVAGNIRAFYEHMRKLGVPTPTAPATDGEAVAWEMRYLPPLGPWSRWMFTTREAFDGRWPYDNALQTEFRALYTTPAATDAVRDAARYQVFRRTPSFCMTRGNFSSPEQIDTLCDEVLAKFPPETKG